MKKRPVIFIVTGVVVVGGILFFLLQPAFGLRQKNSFYPFGIRPGSTADYSADPLSMDIAEVSLRLILEAMQDEVDPDTDFTSRLGTLTAGLQTGVPSITPPMGQTADSPPVDSNPSPNLATPGENIPIATGNPAASSTEPVLQTGTPAGEATAFLTSTSFPTASPTIEQTPTVIAPTITQTPTLPPTATIQPSLPPPTLVPTSVPSTAVPQPTSPPPPTSTPKKSHRPTKSH